MSRRNLKKTVTYIADYTIKWKNILKTRKN